MPVRIAGGRVDLHRDERVAELATQGLEALCEAEGVVAETQPEQAGPCQGALLHPGEVVVGDPDVRLVLLGERERQRRLAQHRRQHDVVDHHGQREAAGEAHADHAHPRAAATLVLRGRGLRNHTVTGLVFFSAKAENSRETQAGPRDCSA